MTTFPCADSQIFSSPPAAAEGVYPGFALAHRYRVVGRTRLARASHDDIRLEAV